MIIYSNDKELITTTIGDLSRKLPLLCWEATSFKGEENRFFKMLSEVTVTRNIKHLTQESMAKEAKKLFRQATNIYDSYEYYDNKDNVGYRVFPYAKFPKIYSFSIIYPAITEFFQYWTNYNNTGIPMKDFLPRYDLSKLFISMENFKDLETIFTIEQGEILKKTLYKEFPEFAIFYYEIYPYINIETIACLNISQLINTRLQMQQLGLDTKQIDALVDNLEVAQNNSQVLKLIKNSKTNL